VPPATGPYRDIRANMERTWPPKGLDHHGPDVRAMGGKGIDAMDEIHVSCAPSPAEAAVTVRGPSWQWT
jgi:hypothetical protein